jgi:transcriptional regulator with XRE-family HTH domain
MSPLEIQFALRKKNITQKALALRIGVSEMSVSDVINGKRVSDRIMRAIAEALGKNYLLVFPRYYLRPPRRNMSKAVAMSSSGDDIPLLAQDERVRVSCPRGNASQ